MSDLRPITNIDVSCLFTCAHADFGSITTKRGWRIRRSFVFIGAVRAQVTCTSGKHKINTSRQTIESINAAIISETFSRSGAVARSLATTITDHLCSHLNANDRISRDRLHTTCYYTSLSHYQRDCVADPVRGRLGVIWIAGSGCVCG